MEAGSRRRREARISRSLAAALALSALLTVIGYRLVVDATAAVLYNADERIPEATRFAWAWAALWGLGNGLLALWAYRAGYVRARNGLVKIFAAGLYVLDLSLLLVLGLRPGGGDLALTVVTVLIAAIPGLLAWRWPAVGGGLLLVLGALLTLGTLYGSATYEGEAAGLLFDEDTFAIFSFGLVPLACGALFVLASILAAAKRRAAPRHSSSR